MLHMAFCDNDDFGYAFPTKSEIARALKKHPKNIQKDLRELERLGHLVPVCAQEGGRSLNNRWFVSPPPRTPDTDKGELIPSERGVDFVSENDHRLIDVLRDKETAKRRLVEGAPLHARSQELHVRSEDDDARRQPDDPVTLPMADLVFETDPKVGPQPWLAPVCTCITCYPPVMRGEMQPGHGVTCRCEDCYRRLTKVASLG